MERELLQLEQEELKRQRTNLLLRENYARKELDHGSKMLLSANRHSLQDINQNAVLNGGQQMPSHLSSSTSSSTSFTTGNYPINSYNVAVDYRQSMPNLLDAVAETPSGHSHHNGYTNGHGDVLTPPAKPSRQMVLAPINGNNADYQNVMVRSSTRGDDDYVQLREQSSSNQPGNMSRHTLHALSAVPKPKLTDVWVQQQASSVAMHQNNNNNKYFPIQRKAPISSSSHDRTTNGESQRIQRKIDAPKGLGYGQHWLIQEAEQRRLDQQRGIRPTTTSPQNWPIKGAGHLHRKSMPDISGEKKALPDAVINTITQRLQSRMSVGNGIVEKRR